jgi:hypothetical protein
VLALLALAATAPHHDIAGPAPPPQMQPRCADFAIAVTGDSSIVFSGMAGLEQPFPAGMSVASCSLSVVGSPYNGMALFTLRAWDPTTLAPDPSTVALRSMFLNASWLSWGQNGNLPRVAFVPPVVTGNEPGVAEPLGAQVAVRVSANLTYDYPRLRGYFNPDGPAELPAAMQFASDGTRSPLPGPHPVLAQAVCAGDTDLVQLRLAQCVMRTDVKPFPAPREFAQRFRVPQQTELRWVELAVAEVFSPYFLQAGDESPMFSSRGPTVLAIVDDDHLHVPSRTMPEPMVEAPFDLGTLFDAALQKTWVAHVDFDRTVTLEPDHDYWIWVRESAQVTFFNRRVHGDESPEFMAGVGPYYCRPDSAGKWTRAADQVLAFRVVGLPTAPPPGPALPPMPRPTPQPGPPTAVTGAFELQASPNPATGFVRVDWSGAVAPVRFQVLDARGRRVDEGTGGAAGSWTWNGTDRDGHAIPSGIYFVHARDSDGHTSVKRAVVVR